MSVVLDTNALVWAFEGDRSLGGRAARAIEQAVLEGVAHGMIGIAANELQNLHDDPADRLIVATALALGASLATSDARLLAWTGPLARIDARV